MIQNKEGKLLLLRRNPAKLKDASEDCWDIPGGRVQKNESLEETLKREVYEETGLQAIVRMRPFTMALSNIRIPVQEGDVGLIFMTYLCDINEESPIQLSSEHVHFDWFEASRAAELLTANFPVELMEKLAHLPKKRPLHN